MPEKNKIELDGRRYCQGDIEKILAELRAVDEPKVHSGPWNPIESSKNEISTRNPGLWYFLEMEKKDKRYP